MLAREVHNALIQFTDDGFLDSRVAQDLLQRTAVPAADDQHALRASHCEHRRVNDHLVIAHIVALGQLDDPVQDQRIPEKFGLDDLDVLILRLFIRQDALDAQSFAVIGMQFLGKPDAHGNLRGGGQGNFDLGFAVQFAKRERIRAEHIFDALDQRQKIFADGAGEYINGAKVVFGPGMETGMRICEEQETGEAVRTELVKALVYNRQAAFTHGPREQRI